MISIGVIKLVNQILSLADFEWDKKRTSNRLIIEDGGLTVRVKEGAGFKNAIGDRVILL